MGSNAYLGLFMMSAALAIFSVIYGVQGLDEVYRDCKITFLIVTCLPIISKISCTYSEERASPESKWMMLLFIQTIIFIVSVTWVAIWCASCNHTLGYVFCMVVAIVLIFIDLLIFFVNVLLSRDERTHIVVVADITTRQANPPAPRRIRMDRNECRASALNSLTKIHPCDTFCDLDSPPDIEEGAPPRVTRDSPPSKNSQLPDCSVCMETTQTVMAECGHPLCIDCCTEYIYHHFARKTFFRCPVCRRRYDL